MAAVSYCRLPSQQSWYLNTNSVRWIFKKGRGAGNLENLRKMKTKMKNFPVRISPFSRPQLGEDQKKRSSLRILAKIWTRPKLKVFAHRLCAKTFCPSYKGGVMPQFCIIFHANHTILATQRGGGMAPCPPLLNTPLLNTFLSDQIENSKFLKNSAKFVTSFFNFLFLTP